MEASSPRPDTPLEANSKVVGRPVTVVSVSFPIGHSIQEIVRIVDNEGAKGCDLIALPEAWLGQEHHKPETLNGPVVSAMSEAAARNQTYIVCPIDRWDGSRRFNSAVLLDRSGDVACVYDKVFPYWAEFQDFKPIVEVGDDIVVYEADFGKVGLSICFDVNFPEVWQRLENLGAEIVIWPSAFRGGMTLQAHAMTHHYYIVNATQLSECFVYDITGTELLHERSDDINTSRITLDLDRGIYHADFNVEWEHRLEKLLAERGDDVELERHWEHEKLYVLRAKRPGISARRLAKEYGLEELREYLSRSRLEIDRRRGWRFARKTL